MARERYAPFGLRMLTGLSSLVAFVALSMAWWIAFIVAALLVGVFALLAAHTDGKA